MKKVPPSPFMSWRHFGVADFFGIAAAIAVGIVVGLLAGDQRGWIALILVATLLSLIRISWPVRHELWLWSAVAVFFAADILALGLVDWSFAEHWSGHALVAWALLYLYTMTAIVYGLYRLNYGPPTDVIEQDPDDLPSYADRDFDL